MTLASRNICLAILLGLLVGHVGMAAHASTHAAGEAGECELCLSYNNASEALPSAPDHGIGPLRENHSAAPDYLAPVAPGLPAFRQRAPPVVD